MRNGGMGARNGLLSRQIPVVLSGAIGSRYEIESFGTECPSRLLVRLRSVARISVRCEGVPDSRGEFQGIQSGKTGSHGRLLAPN